MALSQIEAIKNQFNFKVPAGPLPPPVSRSFLFEIIDTQSNDIAESFTLVLPPTHVSIKEPQRVSVTKTFGNIFVDDYGPDNLMLTIRGFSGTAHAFPTFKSSGTAMDGFVSSGSGYVNSQLGGGEAANLIAQSAGYATEGYTHKTAFYTFRKTIMRYKKNHEADYDKYMLRVSDLYDEQVYDCILLDFTVDRTPDKPLHYPFTISLMVYNQPMSYGDMTATPIPVGGNITDMLAAMDSALNFINTIYGYVQAVKNSVAIIQSTVSQMTAKFNTYLTKIRTIATSPLDLTKQCLDLVGSLSRVVDDAKNQYKMTKDAWAGAKEMIHASYRQNLGLYTQAISEGSQTKKVEVMEFNSTQATAQSAATYSAYLQLVDFLQAQPGDQGKVSASKSAKVESLQFSGVSEYTVKANDTLQSISLRKLGDSSLWPYLASVNKITGNEELSKKTTIYVPVLTRTSSIKKKKDSFILTEDVARNPYGSDITLDATGNIVLAENNDVSTISGIDNIQQAINLRFATPIGSMIKQTSFGIATQAGYPGTDSMIRYLRMNITRAILSDPRIKSVSNIALSVSGDTITASMDIDIIDSDTSIPVEVTL